ALGLIRPTHNPLPTRRSDAMKNSTRLTAIALAFVLPACLAQGGKEQGYEVETVVEGISVPWGMVWLPNGDMLVSDRGGSLYRVRDGKIAGTIAGVPEVHVNGQGGLLDLELHPDYTEDGAENSWIYISYSSPEG